MTARGRACVPGVHACACACARSHASSLQAPNYRFHELWALSRRSFLPAQWNALMNGHVLVSRARIVANSEDFYK